MNFASVLGFLHLSPTCGLRTDHSRRCYNTDLPINTICLAVQLEANRIEKKRRRPSLPKVSILTNHILLKMTVLISRQISDQHSTGRVEQLQLHQVRQLRNTERRKSKFLSCVDVASLRHCCVIASLLRHCVTFGAIFASKYSAFSES